MRGTVLVLWEPLLMKRNAKRFSLSILDILFNWECYWSFFMTEENKMDIL